MCGQAQDPGFRIRGRERDPGQFPIVDHFSYDPDKPITEQSGILLNGNLALDFMSHYRPLHWLWNECDQREPGFPSDNVSICSTINTEPIVRSCHTCSPIFTWV